NQEMVALPGPSNALALGNADVDVEHRRRAVHLYAVLVKWWASKTRPTLQSTEAPLRRAGINGRSKCGACGGGICRCGDLAILPAFLRRDALQQLVDLLACHLLALDQGLG